MNDNGPANGTKTRREVAIECFVGMSREEVIEVALKGCDFADSQDRFINKLCDLVEQAVATGRAAEDVARKKHGFIVTMSGGMDLAVLIEAPDARDEMHESLRSDIGEEAKNQIPKIEWPDVSDLRPAPLPDNVVPA